MMTGDTLLAKYITSKIHYNKNTFFNIVSPQQNRKKYDEILRKSYICALYRLCMGQHKVVRKHINHTWKSKEKL